MVQSGRGWRPADSHAVDGGEGVGAGLSRAEAGGGAQPAQGASLVGGALPGPGGGFEAGEPFFGVEGGQGSDAGRPLRYGHGELLTEAATKTGADAGRGAEAGAGAEKGMGAAAESMGPSVLPGPVSRSTAAARWRL